jgi:hypothetical protein
MCLLFLLGFAPRSRNGLVRLRFDAASLSVVGSGPWMTQPSRAAQCGRVPACQPRLIPPTFAPPTKRQRIPSHSGTMRIVWNRGFRNAHDNRPNHVHAIATPSYHARCPSPAATLRNRVSRRQQTWAEMVARQRPVSGIISDTEEAGSPLAPDAHNAMNRSVLSARNISTAAHP